MELWQMSFASQLAQELPRPTAPWQDRDPNFTMEDCRPGETVGDSPNVEALGLDHTTSGFYPRPSPEIRSRLTVQ